MVAAAIRTIFAQPSAEAVSAQFDRIIDTLEPQFPQVAAMLLDAREDLLAFRAFPIEHWRKIWSTNPVRHEAPHHRVEMKGLHLLAVATA